MLDILVHLVNLQRSGKFGVQRSSTSNVTATCLHVFFGYSYLASDEVQLTEVAQQLANDSPQGATEGILATLLFSRITAVKRSENTNSWKSGRRSTPYTSNFKNRKSGTENASLSNITGRGFDRRG